VRFLEIGHRDAEVVGAAQSGQWHGRVLAFRSPARPVEPSPRVVLDPVSRDARRIASRCRWIHW